MSLLNSLDDEKPAKGPKIVSVKNKIAAPIQITAEQLLREAKEKQLEYVRPPPKQKISDPEELAEFRLRKRKEFEDAIRKNHSTIATWIRYARWEEAQQDIQRSRSVWERALDASPRNVGIWLKYAEMEMRNKQVNHSRNIWDRAVSLLPRANQLWYKYVYMEELLGNIAGARQIFERWMEWQPDEQAWNTYINFELRYKELNRARDIYECFVQIHPDHKNWIRFASFEERNGFICAARKVFERAVEFFGEELLNEKLLLAFAKFEEKQKEHERARFIYKYGLDKFDSSNRLEIYKAYTVHEKKYGDRTGMEDVVVSKRKFQYQEELANDPYDYDTWFDFIRLLEGEGIQDNVREAYERAISYVPKVEEKRHWRRYIHFWIKYVIYEELNCEDLDRAKDVYGACLKLIPHKKFTFAKIWVMYAHFEVRRMNLDKARKILGTSIGICPKDKLFRQYIELEIALREFDRCRKLYEKFLEFSPENSSTWVKFAELESVLGDFDRVRYLFEFAIEHQLQMDMPELVWKSYIDFETNRGEAMRVRALYERLLKKTQNYKVWISYAMFESNVNDAYAVANARTVFERAYAALRPISKEQRANLTDKWLEFEKDIEAQVKKQAEGDSMVEKVTKLLPRKAKNRRRILDTDGVESGWEEYTELIFPDEESVNPSLKLLAMAKQWKTAKK